MYHNNIINNCKYINTLCLQKKNRMIKKLFYLFFFFKCKEKKKCMISSITLCNRHCCFRFIFFTSITFIPSSIIEISTYITFPIIWIRYIFFSFFLLLRNLKKRNTFTAYSLLFLHLLHSVR